MAQDNTTELIWKEAMLIMEQDYTTSDSVSSEDLASGRIIPNPNDDGEHPFTDAPPKPEPKPEPKPNKHGDKNVLNKNVQINDIRLSVAYGNGKRRPWGDISLLFYMLPYFSRRGYNEWLDFNMLILINNAYLVVYHIHSKYEGHNIVRYDLQDDYRKKISDAICDYLFDGNYGKLRTGSSVGLSIDEEDAMEEESPTRARLTDSKEFKHEFSPGA